MVIAIDGLYLLMAKTGLGRYVESLVHGFQTTAPDNRYYLYDGPLDNAIYRMHRLSADPATMTGFTDLSRFAVPTLTAKRTLAALSDYLTGRSQRALDEVDVFWGPGFKGVYRASFKSVITVADMAHEYYPQSIPRPLAGFLRHRLPRELQRADLIIAISENTKADIMKFHNIDSSKIEVIYPGVGTEFSPVTDPATLQAVTRRYRLPQHYILYVGAVQPRKNVESLIVASSVLPGTHKLVIAGGVQWKSSAIGALIARLGVEARVVFTGYVQDCDLPALYSMATAFVMPSLYEGFGLPILEAMACATPVVTSNVSSLPEAAGEAAILINPNSTEELSHAITGIIHDKDLRHELKEKGPKQAALFSWTKAAQQMLHAFATVPRKSQR
ncbi:group 1 glycosyl transferase [Candidatus Magnetobacterium bavaricum]|uniref:Group 1 glycosyl transferase n=1 Tax=Candidatus Magnetobacterium bavaricum TaxID=29290 RepID=A0A0F3GJ71_9BACT|nr:group 1 glycosyl transferase [Candidatus Magnetobacterium bavaricum]